VRLECGPRSQNVVTYTTVVDFANPEMKLFPGMTATLTVPRGHGNRRCEVPNGRVRFTA